jgi:hypothetical protein
VASQQIHASDMKFYQSLGGLGLIGYPTKYGVTSVLRYDRARAALKNRKTRAFHRRPGRACPARAASQH